ncbi:MAG: hypothetical protein PUI88_08025 [Prevotella sp.]|nr:hypothetical protein [Prevotella sp.]
MAKALRQSRNKSKGHLQQQVLHQKTKQYSNHSLFIQTAINVTTMMFRKEAFRYVDAASKLRKTQMDAVAII